MKRILLVVLALVFLLANVPVMAEGRREIEPKTGERVAFYDISSHWAKDIIEKMSDKGLIKGVGNGKFLPDIKMKRSEFAAALHKTLDIVMRYIKAPDINEFYDDVKNEDWYASPLYDLAVLNIIDDRGQFRPDDMITREEMVHYIVNGYNYKLGTVLLEIEDDLTSSFSDDEKIDSKYKKAVKKAVKLGFIKGRGRNMFAPKGITTRAEALVVLDRLITSLEGIRDTIEDGRIEDPVKGIVDVKPLFQKDGDFYKMQLTIINNSEKDITINHSSGQKYDFMILDNKGDTLYKWSDGMMFMQMLTDTVVEAGKSVEFNEKLDSKVYDGFTDKVASFKAFIVGSSENFKINENGYEVKLNKADDGLVIEPDYEKGVGTFKVKVKVTNNSDKSITINHTSSQKFDFKLLDEDKEILYTWSMDKMFLMALTTTVIEAGEGVEFSDEVDMGSYGDAVNKAKYLKAFIVGTSEDVEIDSEGYEIEIK